MLKSLFRITPELLFVVAIFLLIAQLYGYVGETWRLGRSGIAFENFDMNARLIGAFAASLFQPAVLFGMAAIVAALRNRSEG